MARHSIPTAAFKVFTAPEFEQALSYVKSCGHDVVLKASGLAGGKGVLIPQSIEEAIQGLREIMVDNAFGDAGEFPHRTISLLKPHRKIFSQARRW